MGIKKKNEGKGKKETKKETLNKVRLVIFNSLEVGSWLWHYVKGGRLDP